MDNASQKLTGLADTVRTMSGTVGKLSVDGMTASETLTALMDAVRGVSCTGDKLGEANMALTFSQPFVGVVSEVGGGK